MLSALVKHVPSARHFTRTGVRNGATVPRRSIALHSPGPWDIADDLSVAHAAHLDTALAGHLPSAATIHASEEGVVRPGTHFVFFNHAVPEFELDSDGYDNLQAPLNITEQEQIVLRRWYGGSIEFNMDAPLSLGSQAVCHESIEDVRAGPRGHRVTLSIARLMKNVGSEQWAVRERRSLFYLGANSRLLKDSTRLAPHRAQYTPTFSHELVATPLLLFRYSALTFNAHRIHYDRDYARSHEGLDDIIMQGPLMVTLLLRWLTDTVLSASPRRIRQFDYRNLAPVFAGERIALCATHITDTSMEVWITNAAGHVALSGKVVTS